MAFQLDPALAAASRPVADLALCAIRLVDDSRWPWLLLVPQRPGLVELHDLDPGDLAVLAGETARVSARLSHLTGCTKINTAAIGNIVSQLHIHVIARNAGDSNWPGPVWGHGTAIPYARSAMDRWLDRLRAALI